MDEWELPDGFFPFLILMTGLMVLLTVAFEAWTAGHDCIAGGLVVLAIGVMEDGGVIQRR